MGEVGAGICHRKLIGLMGKRQKNLNRPVSGKPEINVKVGSRKKGRRRLVFELFAHKLIRNCMERHCSYA